MRKPRLITLIIFSQFTFCQIANARFYPRYNASLSFGMNSLKKPLVKTIALELNSDIFLSKKSSLSLGIYQDYYFMHKKYPFDTNFVYAKFQCVNCLGGTKIYNRNYSGISFNFFLGYKYWINLNKTDRAFLEARVSIINMINEKNENTYYLRDTSQILHIGPYTHTSIQGINSHGDAWAFPDFIRPGIKLGYLKKFTDRYFLVFDLEISKTGYLDAWQRLSTFGFKTGIGISYRKR
jgi:hypothetical protein